MTSRITNKFQEHGRVLRQRLTSRAVAAAVDAVARFAESMPQIEAASLLQTTRSKRMSDTADLPDGEWWNFFKWPYPGNTGQTWTKLPQCWQPASDPNDEWIETGADTWLRKTI